MPTLVIPFVTENLRRAQRAALESDLRAICNRYLSVSDTLLKASDVAAIVGQIAEESGGVRSAALSIVRGPIPLAEEARLGTELLHAAATGRVEASYEDGRRDAEDEAAIAAELHAGVESPGSPVEQAHPVRDGSGGDHIPRGAAETYVAAYEATLGDEIPF